jgi:hypothetical protein
MTDTLPETAPALDIVGSEEETPLDVAPQRRRVKTEKQDLPLETLHGWIKRGKLELQPEFQRNFVWTPKKASKLVESVLLNVPIPVIYVAEDIGGKLEVVDGQQRLTSLTSFVDGRYPDGREFRLTSLQVLSELNGRRFSELSDEQQNEIWNATLRIIVIEKDSHPDVKFEVFERLNEGAEKLNDQELRNCVYRGSYNILLGQLAENPYMLKIMGAKEPHNRMADRQLILRFFAMWRNTHLKYRGPMKQFLNREMEGHRFATDREIAEMRTAFEKSIEMAYHVFGTNAFRRYNPGTETTRGHWESNKLNMGLWDTLLYSFSFYEKPQVILVADRIREEFLDVMTHDERFVEYVTSTGDKVDRLQYRADVWMTRLKEVLGNPHREPRSFTLQIKTGLHDADPTCALCQQRIHDVDDAEVDHILHYWRGGRTIPENARLVHRYCNRSRGGRD